MPYRICFSKIRRKWLISDFIPKKYEKSKFSKKLLFVNEIGKYLALFRMKFNFGEISKTNFKTLFWDVHPKSTLKNKNKIVRFAIKILIWGIEILEIFSLWIIGYMYDSKVMNYVLFFKNLTFWIFFGNKVKNQPIPRVWSCVYIRSSRLVGLYFICPIYRWHIYDLKSLWRHQVVNKLIKLSQDIKQSIVWVPTCRRGVTDLGKRPPFSSLKIFCIGGKTTWPIE